MILLADSAEKSIADTAKEYEVFNILMKPVELADLIRTIETATKNRVSKRRNHQEKRKQTL
ncbi:hypothetical protein ACFL5L_02735 [candidate division KSB1 bacterium]